MQVKKLFSNLQQQLISEVHKFNKKTLNSLTKEMCS